VKRETWVDIAAVTVCVYFLIAAYGKYSAHDDTDPPDGRSGLALYRDALTGCEYVGHPWPGGITPRLRADGSQVCRDMTQEAPREPRGR
jgi:hypothetical protein